MKKNLLTLFVLLAMAASVFGQYDMTINGPFQNTGTNAFVWGGDYQLGATLYFDGTYETPAQCDSIICKVYYGTFATWNPTIVVDTFLVDSVLIEDGDGVFSTNIDIPADWRPQNWQEWGDIPDDPGTIGDTSSADSCVRPLIQVQRFYDGDVVNYMNQSINVLTAMTDTFGLNGVNFIDTLAGEYEPGDTLNFSGWYGIAGGALTYIAAEIYDGIDGTEIIADWYPAISGNFSNSGKFSDIEIILPASMDAVGGTLTVDSNRYVSLWSLHGGATWSNRSYLKVLVVEEKMDSILITAPAAAEWTDENTTVATTTTLYPAAPTLTDVVYTSSDEAVATVDASGVVTFAEPATGTSASVDITVTGVYSGMSSTVTVSMNNNFDAVEEYAQSGVSVYPNPATSELNITGVDNANIEIFNLLGAKVMSTQLENNIISVESLPAGTYVISIQNNDETIVRKISIQ